MYFIQLSFFFLSPDIKNITCWKLGICCKVRSVYLFIYLFKFHPLIVDISLRSHWPDLHALTRQTFSYSAPLVLLVASCFSHAKHFILSQLKRASVTIITHLCPVPSLANMMRNSNSCQGQGEAKPNKTTNVCSLNPNPPSIRWKRSTSSISSCWGVFYSSGICCLIFKINFVKFLFQML